MEQKPITDIKTNELPSHADILVVGGGIAGLMAAIALARQNFQVVLCEKKSYPRDKVCGACLNANALATLEALQLTSVLDELQAPTLTQVQIQCGRRTVQLPLPSGRAITRREFDLALAKTAVSSGVTIVQNTTASLESSTPLQTTRQVRLQDSRHTRLIDASLVLIAAGLGGIRETSKPWPSQIQPNSKIGMGLNLHTEAHNIRPHTIHLCVRQEGYLGLVLAEKNQLNLAAAIQPNLLKDQLPFGAWVRQTLRQYNLHIDFPLEEAEWRGTPALTRTIQQPYGHRWLAIGDSAGYVEPFTGEGMAWAMAGGVAAANLISENLLNWNTQQEEKWGELYRQMIRQRQWSCRSLAWLLQTPLRSRIAIEAATWLPGIGHWFVKDINRQTRNLKIEDTSIRPSATLTS
jgi:flavin-dependent dehydrogenase